MKRVKKNPTPAELEAYQTAVFAAQVDAIELIDAYKANPPKTSKEKALVENAIWLKVDPKYRTIIVDMKGYEAMWLAYVLTDGGQAAPFKARARALKELRRGFNVKPAWEALDEGVRPEHIYEAFSSASTAAKNAPDGETHQRFEQVLIESIAKPFRGRVRESKQEPPAETAPKLKEPSKELSLNDTRNKLAQRSKTERKSNRATPLDELTSESKALWGAITVLLDQEIPPFVSNRLNGLAEASQIEEISEEFKLEVNACYQNLLGKIRHIRARGTSKEILNTKHSEVIEASEVLGLKVPSRSSRQYRGWRPDPDLAKKAYFKLAARFHPDKNPGDERAAQRFKSVQDAWNILKSI